MKIFDFKCFFKLKNKTQVPCFKCIVRQDFFRKSFLCRFRRLKFYKRTSEHGDFSFNALRVKSLRTGRPNLLLAFIKNILRKIRFKEVEFGGAGIIIRRRGW